MEAQSEDVYLVLFDLDGAHGRDPVEHVCEDTSAASGEKMNRVFGLFHILSLYVFLIYGHVENTARPSFGLAHSASSLISILLFHAAVVLKIPSSLDRCVSGTSLPETVAQHSSQRTHVS